MSEKERTNEKKEKKVLKFRDIENLGKKDIKILSNSDPVELKELLDHLPNYMEGVSKITNQLLDVLKTSFETDGKNTEQLYAFINQALTSVTDEDRIIKLAKIAQEENESVREHQRKMIFGLILSFLGAGYMYFHFHDNNKHDNQAAA